MDADRQARFDRAQTKVMWVLWLTYGAVPDEHPEAVGPVESAQEPKRCEQISGNG